MYVTFNPNSASFRAATQSIQNAAPEKNTTNTVATGEVVMTSNQPEKKVKKHRFKNFIANMVKTYVATKEMTKGVFKGLFNGAVTGSAILGASWLLNTLPNAFRNSGLKEVCNNPIKSIGTKSKVLAGVAAVAVFAGHIVAAKLKSNQKTADVDHQFKVGHRDF